jgi:hypothetical protein
VALGLRAITSYSDDVNVRVHEVGVRDLVSVVPAGYRSDDLDALRTHASPEAGPWETLR